MTNIAQAANAIRGEAQTLNDTAAVLPQQAAEFAGHVRDFADRIEDLNVCRLAALMRAMQSLQTDRPQAAPCVCEMLGLDILQSEPCNGHQRMSCAPCH